MNKAKQIYTWIRRAKHCRGFGVQSPTDYSYVCNVINFHRKLREYEVLEKRFAIANHRERKLLRLYFRIAKHENPCDIYVYPSASEACAAYLTAGAPNCNIHASDCRWEAEGGPVLTLIMMKGGYAAFYHEVRQKAETRMTIVLQGIRDSKENKRFWKQLLSDEDATITFDLYDVGIVITDKKRYKQNYIINF